MNFLPCFTFFFCFTIYGFDGIKLLPAPSLLFPEPHPSHSVSHFHVSAPTPGMLIYPLCLVNC